MKALSLFVIGFATIITAPGSSWQASVAIENPESVYFDAKSNQVFVSNIAGAGTEKDGKGWIQILSPNGVVIKNRWVEGLNAPKGMRSLDGILWVTDIDTVVTIDIATGTILEKIQIPGAKFLNDIAVSKDGDIFVSDTLGRTIYKIKNEVEVFFQGDETESPNGLLIKGNELIVAAWGLANDDWSAAIPGNIYSLNLDTKAKTLITKAPLGNLDGLEIANDGSYIASDWVSGKIYKVSVDGEVSLLPIEATQSSADIGYVPATNTLLIPYMNLNYVKAVNLN